MSHEPKVNTAIYPLVNACENDDDDDDDHPYYYRQHFHFPVLTKWQFIGHPFCLTPSRLVWLLRHWLIHQPYSLNLLTYFTFHIFPFLQPVDNLSQIDGSMDYLPDNQSDYRSIPYCHDSLEPSERP